MKHGLKHRIADIVWRLMHHVIQIPYRYRFDDVIIGMRRWKVGETDRVSFPRSLARPV